MLIDTRVGKLFVEVSGHGPDVILWHSLLCDGDMWREQTGELDQHCRFVNIDAPGHGRSERTRRRYTMDDCVMATLEIMDALSIPQATLCGLSWGGMVFMRLAARYPERVSSLVLMNTSARAERFDKKTAYRVLASITTWLGPAPPLVRILRPIFFAPKTQRERRDRVARFEQHVLSRDRVSLRRAVDAVIFDRSDCSPELGQIRAPTLILAGDQDRATPPRQARWLAAQIRGAELVIVPESGHLSAMENPDFVNARLVQFLDRTHRSTTAPEPIRA